MINIVEQTPKKISGLTSLFLSIPYNESIIDIIKSSGVAVWHKKDKVWEVPLTSLSFLLDNLVYFDDILLKLLPDKSVKNDVKQEVIYKTKPFPYQEEGILYGLSNNKWMLLDSPGLGKTLQIIYLAEELKKQKGLEHCLVICGINTLKANWKKEIKKHSSLDCVVIGEKYNKNGKLSATPATIKERAAQLKNKINEFFIIINIESLRNEEVIEAIKNSENKIEMCAFDEVHKAKSSQSQQGHNMLKLDNFKYQVAMTGTLLMNSPLDAYTPLKWIGIEQANLTTFKNIYCVFGGFGGYEVVGYKNLDLLKNEIESCSLRRTKDILDLPPKTVIEEMVEMSDEHRKFYQDIKNGVKEAADKVKLDFRNLLALTTRLRQATTCPSVLTSTPIISSKIDRCMSLIEDILSQGDKVVVMSTFKEPIYQLQELLKEHHPLIGTGDLKDSEVSNNIDLFQHDDNYKIFLGTTSKCGTGITLNAARYMICLDCPWTDALQVQVEDRIHRADNTKSVFIYRLICEDSIDEVVASILERKKAISDYVIDDKDIELLKKYILDL